MKLCDELPPLPNLEGKHYGFFGNTGVGKSSLVNAIYGADVAKVEYNQTTLDATPFRIPNSKKTIWDLLGQTDEISYLNATYVGLLKSMSLIGICVTRTCHEISRIIELLEYLNLPYCIIVNKMDIIEKDCEEMGSDFDQEFQIFKTKFETEIEKIKFHPNSIFYISSKSKDQFVFRKLLDKITDQ